MMRWFRRRTLDERLSAALVKILERDSRLSPPSSELHVVNVQVSRVLENGLIHLDVQLTAVGARR